MEEILNLVYDYNSVIFDVNNSEDWNELKIPHSLIDKQTKIQFQIFEAIMQYCITKGCKKPVNIIVNNIWEQFFKVEQLVPVNSFKTYVNFITY